MIGEITFNGYKFFENNQTLSFFADARTKKLLSNASIIDNKRTLKAVAVYGSNNSGKTNVVVLLKLIKEVLKGTENLFFNNPIFKDNPEATISITFNNNDGCGWYTYTFTYNQFTLKYIYEKLEKTTYYENAAPYRSIIFEKDLVNKHFIIFDNDKTNFIELVSARRPLLNSLELDNSEFSNLKEESDRLKKLSDSINVIEMYNIPLMETISTLKGNNIEKKKFIVEFVKHADLSITNFEYDENLLKIDNELNDEIQEKALNNNFYIKETLHLATTYKNAKVPSFLFDSSGTKKIEAIASYIYDAIKNGNTLVVDELDNGLHYCLSRAIVGAFNSIANIKGQLLFTAHDLILFDNNNLMRKDQIYFVERNKEKAKLYCLKESVASDGGPRELTDVIKRYNHGDFVKLPVPSFIDEILNIKKE